jgi:fimbrial isopeptide formation D2 family protein/uncharacterized repeat protein (TIGR01451 family)
MKNIKKFAIIFAVSLVFVGVFAQPSQAAAQPSVTFNDVDQNPLVGESSSFNLQFDNIGDSVGFGPYIDLLVPAGITLSSAQLLSTGLPLVNVGTFPVGDPSCLVHPYALDSNGDKSEICLSPNPGEDVKLYVIKLPFGSFAAEQDGVEISITMQVASDAAVNIPVDIKANAGFYLGSDALNNPTTDPSFTGPSDTVTVTPSVVKITKRYVHDYLATNPEDNKIVPGENNQQQFRVTADIADGVTIENLVLEDILQEPFIRINEVGITPAGFTNSSAGATSTITWPSVTGTTSAVDAQFFIEFMVPNEYDGDPVLDAANSYKKVATNAAKATGEYGDDGTFDITGSLNLPIDIEALTARKNVTIATDNGAVGPTPGDILEYRIEGNLSDYMAFEDFKITDVLPDGLIYLPASSTMTLEHGATILNTETNDPIITPGATPGSTSLAYVPSGSFPSQLLGGCVPVGGGAPDCALTNVGRAKVVLKFQATIENQYDDATIVEHGQVLVNNVTINSQPLSPETLLPAGAELEDTSQARTQIVSGTFTKSVYAVNGSTTIPSQLISGDAVTYRLEYNLPSSDFGTITINDYLPLPMFSNTEMTTFDSASPLGTIPVAGVAGYGPTETLYPYTGIAPTMSTDDGNVVRFVFDDTNDDNNIPRKVDILFTTTILDKPYAPGLSVTNQATISENNAGVLSTSTNIQQIDLEVPEPEITKGIVASDSAAAVYLPTQVGPVPFSSPGTAGARFTGEITSANLAVNEIKSDIEGIDAHDIVTYAIVVENTGKGETFNTQIKDVLPNGMEVPVGGLNLNVSDGAGVARTYNNIGGGTGLLDQGIEITDPIDDLTTATNGSNILVITYDLQIAELVNIGKTIENQAHIIKFAGRDGGVNYVSDPTVFQDIAEINTLEPSVTKVVSNTSLADTAGTAVVVGEEVEYTVTMNIPEGTFDEAQIRDTLDQCLAFTSLTSLTASPEITSSEGSIATILSNANISNVGAGAINEGRKLNLDFGTLTNTADSNETLENITLVYKAVVLNGTTCNRATALNNNATLLWGENNGDDVIDPDELNVSAAAPNVVVNEPTITLTKTFPTPTGDTNDVVPVRLTIAAASTGGNRSPAYNVSLTDILGTTDFTYEGGLTHISGVAPTTSGEAAETVSFAWDQLNPGQTSVVQFNVKLNSPYPAGSAHPNSALVNYTSYPDVPSGIDTYNSLACERTGDTEDCGGASNDYSQTKSTNYTVENLAVDLKKSVVSTSEPHTIGNNLAIGEIVRYRLQMRVTESTTNNVSIRDVLPNGLQFVDDSTANIALVATDGITSTSIPAGAFVTGDETTLASITPSFSIPVGAISGGPFTNGTDLNVNLGTLANNDNDANQEFVVVEFNALAVNNVINVRVSNVSNQLSALQNGTVIGSSPASVSVIQEPNIEVNKSVTTAPVDAGDTITYTINVTNTSGTNVSTGYDGTFEDTLNEHLEFSSITIVSSPAYSTVTSNTSLGVNDEVGVEFDELRPGDTISFTISATVKDSAPASYIVPNTGTAEVTSLPGAQGTLASDPNNTTGSSTPGDTDDPDGERTTSDDGAASATLGSPSISKTGPTEGNSASIGATVSYPITVTVPQGTTLNATVRDVLPAGLAYVSHSVDTTGFTGLFANPVPVLDSPATTPGGSGEDVELNFGTINVPGDTGTYDSFVVTVVAEILDIPSNKNSTVLNNQAAFDYTNPNNDDEVSVTSSTVPLTIYEPQLALSKALADQDPVGNGFVDVGDNLDYTISIENVGLVPAHTWELQDILPDHTTLETSPSCSLEGTNVPVAVSNAIGTLMITPTSVTPIPADQTIVCTYTLSINSTAVIGSTYSNVADVDWWSGPVTSTGARQYNDDDVNEIDGDDDTDSANFTMNGATFEKTTSSTSTTIGAITTYTLSIDATDGIIDDLVVEDVLPAGLIYNNTTEITGVIPVSPSVTTPNDGSVATTITWDFGSVTHSSAEPIVITYETITANVLANQDATTLNNNAEVTYTPEGEDPLVQEDDVTIEIQEPVLSLDKSANLSTALFGQEIEYTLVVDHEASSTSSAYDVVVEDTLPAGLTLVSGSTSSTDSGWSFTETTSGFTATNNSIGLGNTSTITYKASVDSPPDSPNVGDTLSNDATLTWTSVNGVSEYERDGSDGATGLNDYADDDVTSVDIEAIDLKVTSTPNTSLLLPGETIIYTLNGSNLGSVTATDAVITHKVPEGTVFVASDSTVGWSCADGAVAGTVCTFDLGDLDPAEDIDVEFAVRVLDSELLTDGMNGISGTATISSPASNGVEISMLNNSSTIDTPFSIANIIVTKEDSVDPVLEGNYNFSYTITVKNDGPADATNVVMKDVLPNGMVFVEIVSDDATAECSESNGTILCEIPLLENGETTTFQLTVEGTILGQTKNTATAQSDQYDPTSLDNKATAETHIGPLPVETPSDSGQNGFLNMARTGRAIGAMVFVALMLFGLGSLILIVQKRKRSV